MEETAERSDLPPCPSCGTGVEPDWDWCHACGFDPDGLRPDEPDARPPPPRVATSPPPAPAVDDRADARVIPLPLALAAPDPPDLAPRPSPSSRRGPAGWRRTALVVAGVLVLVAGAFVVVRQVGGGGRDTADPPPTTVQPPPHAWVSYTAPDGSFTARFPGEPTAQDQIVPLDATTSFTMHMYLYESGDTGFGVLESTTVAAMPFGLSTIAAGMALGAGGSIGLQAPTELQGYPALDASIAVDGGIMLVTAVQAGARVVVIEHVAPQPDPLVWARFRSSVVITPA